MLPLLHVLRTIRPEQRVILLAHFDDQTRDALYATIGQVLKSNKVPIRNRLLLKAKLFAHKDKLRYLADKKKTSTSKRRKLAQIGGSPMKYILKTAIPLLLNLFTE